MPEAARAPVKPRIHSTETGTALPLEDEVGWWLDQRGPAFLTLAGGAGSGKTTALRHLAAVFSHTKRLKLLDESPIPQQLELEPDDVVVFVGTCPTGTRKNGCFWLRGTGTS
jgi:energy-coupling factor transporter ATP-binding protein EcfA2